MKLQCVANLCVFAAPRLTAADVRASVLCVLGNIAPVDTPVWRDFVRTTSELWGVVLYVPGPLEYRDKVVQVADAEARQFAQALGNVHWLQHNSVQLGGVRVLGATLWDEMPAEDQQRIHLENTFGHILPFSDEQRDRQRMGTLRWLAKCVHKSLTSHQPLLVCTHAHTDVPPPHRGLHAGMCGGFEKPVFYDL